MEKEMVAVSAEEIRRVEECLITVMEGLPSGSRSQISLAALGSWVRGQFLVWRSIFQVKRFAITLPNRGIGGCKDSYLLRLEAPEENGTVIIAEIDKADFLRLYVEIRKAICVDVDTAVAEVAFAIAEDQDMKSSLDEIKNGGES